MRHPDAEKSPAVIARTSRLTVSPLRPEDLDDAVDLLLRPELYTVTGGAPRDHADAGDRVRRWLAGSADPRVTWINHVTRREDTGMLVGHCQGTVSTVGRAGETDCTLGYSVHPDHQGQGIAREMMRAFVGLVVETAGPGRFLAHIAPGHTVSERVATGLGLSPTGTLDRVGEQIWASATAP